MQIYQMDHETGLKSRAPDYSQIHPFLMITQHAIIICLETSITDTDLCRQSLKFNAWNVGDVEL